MQGAFFAIVDRTARSRPTLREMQRNVAGFAVPD